MKPMLSATLDDVRKATYPVLLSPKLDGIRCLIIDGIPVSRNLKWIPNASIFAELRRLNLPPLDGELIVGRPQAADCYRATNSGVMSKDGEPNWTFWVFDVVADRRPFDERIKMARDIIQKLGHRRIRLVPHALCQGEGHLLRFEEQHLLAGYEGIMGRDPRGFYKFGRATLREGGLWKLKRFHTGEAKILGFEEQMHNANELQRDNLGRAKRSSHKENKHGKDTLGALKVQDTSSGVQFDIGTGFTDEERQLIWSDRSSWMGRVVGYKSLLIGVKEKPRFPVYLGERRDL